MLFFFFKVNSCPEPSRAVKEPVPWPGTGWGQRAAGAGRQPCGNVVPSGAVFLLHRPLTFVPNCLLTYLCLAALWEPQTPSDQLVLVLALQVLGPLSPCKLGRLVPPPALQLVIIPPRLSQLALWHHLSPCLLRCDTGGPVLSTGPVQLPGRLPMAPQSVPPASRLSRIVPTSAS